MPIATIKNHDIITDKVTAIAFKIPLNKDTLKNCLKPKPYVKNEIKKLKIIVTIIMVCVGNIKKSEKVISEMVFC